MPVVAATGSVNASAAAALYFNLATKRRVRSISRSAGSGLRTLFRRASSSVYILRVTRPAPLIWKLLAQTLIGVRGCTSGANHALDTPFGGQLSALTCRYSGDQRMGRSPLSGPSLGTTHKFGAGESSDLGPPVPGVTRGAGASAGGTRAGFAMAGVDLQPLRAIPVRYTDYAHSGQLISRPLPSIRRGLVNARLC